MHRKIACLLFCCIFITKLSAQPSDEFSKGRAFGISFGLGLSVVKVTDIVDYINLRYLPLSKLDDFTSAPEFFGGVELGVSETWGMKLEYAYMFKSYNLGQGLTSPDVISYGVHMPTVLIQYLIYGQGYAVKVGGGLGYHIAILSEDYSFYGNQRYSSSGIGIKAELEGNTAFDDHLFGYIVIDIRENIMNEFKDSDGSTMLIPLKATNARLNLFSLGLKFGFIYYIH